MPLNPLQLTLESHLEQHSAHYIAVAQSIFAQPETGNNEYFASEQLTHLLSAQGFDGSGRVAGQGT